MVTRIDSLEAVKMESPSKQEELLHGRQIVVLLLTNDTQILLLFPTLWTQINLQGNVTITGRISLIYLFYTGPLEQTR